MSDDRKPLPETGFRCYPAKPESITCNMTIIVDQMLAWLEAEKANGTNIKKDGQGQSVIRLTMLPTKRQDAKTSHFFAYDDYEKGQQANQGGGFKQNSKPMTAAPISDDIPF